MSSSSCLLTPPAANRGRSSSITNPGLTLKSLAPRSRPLLDLPPQPQTPSSLVRKDTAPTVALQHTAASSSSAAEMDGAGNPHRPMLSVLVSLSVAALPAFVRPSSSSARTGRYPKEARRSGSRTPRVWDAVSDEPVTPPSPFTSLFITPPHPSSLLPTPADPATIRRHRSSFAPILILLTIFVFSLFPVGIALTSLPITAFRSLPKTVKDVAQLGHELKSYADSSTRGRLHVIAVLSLTAVWKHAWSIPGSVVLNIIAGTILSPIPATLLMTFLTSIGSLAATLLSTPLAPLVSGLFPRALSVTRTALQGSPTSEFSEKGSAGDQTPTWVRLVVMRLVGVVPWSGINVACGVCGVALWECFVGSFIGTLPWTAVTCQIGDIIQTLSAASSLTTTGDANPQTLSSVLASPSIILKLVFLSALSLGPVLGRDKLRSVLGGGATDEAPALSDDGASDSDSSETRWKFWSRSTSRRGSIDELSSEEEEIFLEK